MLHRLMSGSLASYGKRLGLLVALLGMVGLLTTTAAAAEYIADVIWQTPPVVEPGVGTAAPQDAVVLFDGKDMSQWNNADKWAVQDGAVTSGGNDIQSKAVFGDCQVHLEWAEPEKVEGKGQDRGNSGLYLMGLYEVQILDSYKNRTYVDGQCGAVYKQHPPLVNVSRKPGEWQTYDVIFEAPKFDAQGAVTKPAFVTVFQNGVVVQNHFQIEGRTFWEQKPHYEPHAEKGPIQLQYHNNPVRFRNIWVRDLKPLASRPAGPSGQAVSALVNTLSDAEKAAGWQLLFDGQSFKGWHYNRGREVGAGWKVIDGAICRVSQQAEDLYSDGQYDNFILEFDYQVPENSNSGLFFRADESVGYAWMTAIELQLLDNANPHGDAQKSGWAYDLYRPEVDPKTGVPLDATKPVGQWNHAKLVCNGPHVEHWINGVKYFEYELGSEDFNARVAKSKFAGQPQFAKIAKGCFSIQGDHGCICFANLKLLPLSK